MGSRPGPSSGFDLEAPYAGKEGGSDPGITLHALGHSACMWLGGGGSWPFLCASMSCWSFAIPPHLEPSHPIPLGTDPQEPTNLQSRLGGGFVPSCTCLPVPSLLLITSGRGTAILTLQPLPPPPPVALESGCPLPAAEGKMLKTSGCAYRLA